MYCAKNYSARDMLRVTSSNKLGTLYTVNPLLSPRGRGGLIEKGGLFEGGEGLMKCNKDNGIISL